MGYAMVIDLKKCVGCNACAVSCKTANGTPPHVSRSKVMKREEGTFPNVRRTSLPVLCMHCKNAPCVNACPTGATSQNPVTGVVSVDKESCIGCRACVAACPYSARYFVDSEDGYYGALTPFEQRKYKDMPKGTVDKCTFCEERVVEGGQPACVKSCITGCRIFGEEEDLQELIRSERAFVLHPEFGTRPSVYYLK